MLLWITGLEIVIPHEAAITKNYSGEADKELSKHIQAPPTL